MWRLNVNEPERDSLWVELKPGVTSLGRGSANTITISDTSASRQHAEILWDNAKDTITIHDLNSTNGTYVNRKRISTVLELRNGDTVRIGRAVLHLTNESGELRRSALGTHFFTREIVLESLDEHAVMIDEVAQKLNAVLDVEDMVREIVAQLKRILVLEEVEVLLAAQFKTLRDSRAVRAIQSRSVEVTEMNMYVPIISSDDVDGLIRLTRRVNSRPFSHRDMGLAVAISHQAVLTLNRLQLLEKNREQERMRELLLRFVSPLEVDYLLKDYLATGQLPELVEQKATILFSDIANSTGIAERIGTKPFASLLTRYYQDVTNVVFRYGGIIKYMGDGIMAAFVSTSSQTVVPQEVRAVQAGMNILNQIKRNDYLLDGEPLVVGVAVNTGPAMVGYIGVGTRAEFNVLGDTVNTASRMESFARPNRLLIGPETLRNIEGRIPAKPFATIDVRGRSAPIQVFEVVGK
ncbi:MAG: FHA domain-containing protein [Anaerolineales bacterium]|nr:FHA domain-containing protein [Anaerolineales bacterium]